MAACAPASEQSNLLAPKRPSATFAKRRKKADALRASFFRIGCGSSITFNAVVMGVAYLRSLFGAGVLRELSLAHNVALLSCLLSLTAAGARPGSPFDRPRTCARLLQAALAFAALFNGAMLAAIVGVDVERRGGPAGLERALVACVAVNGAATAVVQGVGATFGGHADRAILGGDDAGASTSAAQLSGAGLGVLVPTLTQLLCVAPAAVAANPRRVRGATRLGAGLGALLGLVSCVAAGFEARRLAKRHFPADAAPAAPALGQPSPASSATSLASLGALEDASPGGGLWALAAARRGRAKTWSQGRLLSHARGSVDLDALRRCSARSDAPLMSASASRCRG